VNAVVQILCRVVPFRNYFLDESNYSHVTQDPLVITFGELVRKIWNARNFKSHVSPHEFLQAVTNASKKKFKITEQSDPFSFLSWLLNALHNKLKVNKKSIVHKVFKGKLKVTTRKLPPTEKETSREIDPDSPEYQEKTAKSQFLILPLDVPPPPLFTDDLEKSIIPQVPLFELLNKYDGVTEKEYQSSQDLFVKKFEITEMPQYLLVHVSRFTKNTFFTEKNPTIVNFPVKNLVMKDYVSTADDTTWFKYDLVANIVHEGLPEAGKGTYNAQVLHKGREMEKKIPWFDTQDLHVDEILPQMITLSTSYIQVWERQPDTPEELEKLKEQAQAQVAAEGAPEDGGASAPMEQDAQ
jgi:U4/U6.U5 tri-snRNP-associated protein 2